MASPTVRQPRTRSLVRKAAEALKLPSPTLTQVNVLQLLNYDWPGNVRELQNLIERAVIVSGSGKLAQ